MRRNASSFFCLTIMLCWLMKGGNAMGNDAQSGRSLTNVLLQEDEIEQLKVKKEGDDRWVKGIDEGRWILFIYNRWGDLIYQSGDYKNDWSPKNISPGVYSKIIDK